MIRTGSVVVAAFVAFAGAQSVTLDEATWLAGLTGPLAMEDFNSEPEVILPGGVDTAFSGFSVRPETDGSSFVTAGTGGNNVDGTTHLDLFVAPEDTLFGFPLEAVTLTFDAPTTAVAFDFADLFSAASSGGVDIFVDGTLVGNTIALGVGGNSGAVSQTFIGISSGTAFTTIQFASPVPSFGETFGIDNIRYQVPAPAGAAALGLAGVAAMRRRR